MAVTITQTISADTEQEWADLQALVQAWADSSATDRAKTNVSCDAIGRVATFTKTV